jgi:hypothetical protein
MDLFGVSPIISGLRKTEKLNLRPYGNYFHGFAQSLSLYSNLLVIGYGGKDIHVNFWLREFLEIHGVNARLVEITTAFDPEQSLCGRLNLNLEWNKNEQGVYSESSGVFKVIDDGISNACIIDPMKILNHFRDD